MVAPGAAQLDGQVAVLDRLLDELPGEAPPPRRAVGDKLPRPLERRRRRRGQVDVDLGAARVRAAVAGQHDLVPVARLADDGLELVRAVGLDRGAGLGAEDSVVAGTSFFPVLASHANCGSLSWDFIVRALQCECN